MSIELIANYGCHIGENPLWNPLDQRLYWLDISSGTIYWYDPAIGIHEMFYKGDVTGGFTIQTDGSLLLFGIGGRISRLHHGQLTTLYEELPGEEHNRFNDVIADPLGGVLCGTMPYGSSSTSGNLYRLGVDGSIKKVWDGIKLSNGMGFSPDLKTFYYSDSRAYDVTQFDYNSATGEISNRRPFAALAPDASQGDPDGLTVDAEGFVWLAVWDGWRMIRYDPDGTIEREVTFPVKKVSSLAFGGDNLTDIYITSAGGDDCSQNGEHAGGLFRLRQEIRGRPEYLSRVRVGE